MRLFFRVMFMLAMIAVEKVCGDLGYMAGFAWKSLKDGHSDGKSDRQYRQHREFVRFNAPIVRAKFGNILKKPMEARRKAKEEKAREVAAFNALMDENR